MDTITTLSQLNARYADPVAPALWKEVDFDGAQYDKDYPSV